MLKNLLNTYTDNQLVKLVKKNSSGDAFSEICVRYENIFYKVCQKYVNALSASGVNVKDIFDEKDYIIFHCISTYDESKKTKLSTWIGNYARYLCLNAINSRRFIVPSVSEEEIRKIEESRTTEQYDENKSYSAEDFNYILNIIDQLKDPRVGEVFKYRYFCDKKMIWSKIAKKMKMSTQTAINLHNKGIKILRKKIKSKNISDIV